MNKIVVDAQLRGKLRDLKEPLALCDESGKVLAHVVPKFDSSEYENIEPPPLSKEELQRRLNSDKWYTTQEVLDHLEQL